MKFKDILNKTEEVDVDSIELEELENLDESKALKQQFISDIFNNDTVTFTYELEDDEMLREFTVKSVDVLNELGGSTRMFDNGSVLKLIKGDKREISSWKKYLSEDVLKYTFESTKSGHNRVLSMIYRELSYKNNVVAVYYNGRPVYLDEN